MWTVLTLLREAEKYLRSRRIPSPRLEAELLLAHALALDRVRLYMDFDRPVEDGERGRFRALILRRIRGEPTAYITGRKEFFSLSFRVPCGGPRRRISVSRCCCPRPLRSRPSL